ncbi:amphiregulin [Rhinoderma darwinii]|uniref:amphiregulin n=1 Tax=Rhinoderma darwinii TaxID=43563 RepID=UPI003F666C25
MSSQLSLVWSILLLCLACTYTVHCSVSNATENEITVTLSGGGDGIAAGLENAREVDYDEYDEDEKHELSVSGYYVDDSIRVQAVVKPANGDVPATIMEKKKADKKKNGQKNKKKKKTPCQTTHKNFCVHGKCRYLATVPEVSCKCHENYFGERCTEQYLRAGSKNANDMTTTTILAVVAVLLSTISITAIIIIIVVHTRRKYSSYGCEAEETKKLGQENGSEDV